MLFEGVDALEDAVVEGLLAQVVPQMLDRIEFRRVGWQPEQAKIGGQLQRFTLMPPGPIEHHEQAFLGVAGCHFIEEDLHAIPIDMGQDQGIQLAVAHTHRRIGVGVFLGHHGLAHRAQGFGAPAAANVRNAAKACLVLEQQFQRPLAREGLLDLGERFGEFFFHASWAVGSA